MRFCWVYFSGPGGGSSEVMWKRQIRDKRFFERKIEGQKTEALFSLHEIEFAPFHHWILSPVKDL